MRSYFAPTEMRHNGWAARIQSPMPPSTSADGPGPISADCTGIETEAEAAFFDRLLSRTGIAPPSHRGSGMTYLTRPIIFIGQTFWTVLPLVVVTDLAAIYLLIFREKMDPRSFAFWISLIIALPFLGFALYLLYGCTLYSASIFGRKLGKDREMRLLDDPRIRGADIPTYGNDVRFYGSALSGYGDITEDIGSAAESVHLEIYSLPEGKDGAGLVDALCSKAREGLDVRMLIGRNVPLGLMDLRRMKEAGAEVSTFHRRLKPLFTVSLRFKNRRVLAVIDGKISYAGEQSVIRAEGPAASRLEARFLADWSFAAGKHVPPAEQAEGCGDTKVQIVSSGPDSEGGPNPALFGYVEMMKSAESSITLSEPYLVPDEDIYSFLKLAAFSGIDVRIVVSPGNFWYQKWNTASAASSLLDSGIRVFFANSRFRDSLMAVDGRKSGISLAPFNGRAMLHDFHTSVLVESEEMSAEVEKHLGKLIESSAELHIEDYRRRTVLSRVKIAFSRIMMLFNRGRACQIQACSGTYWTRYPASCWPW